MIPAVKIKGTGLATTGLTGIGVAKISSLKYKHFHTTKVVLTDNGSESPLTDTETTASGSVSPDSGPIDASSATIDRTKFIAAAYGNDRDSIESYFDSKKIAVKSAYENDPVECRNTLDELYSQEADVKDLAGLSVGNLSPTQSPNPVSSSNSEVQLASSINQEVESSSAPSPEAEPKSGFLQDSSDIIGGDEPMDFGDE